MLPWSTGGEAPLYLFNPEDLTPHNPTLSSFFIIVDHANFLLLSCFSFVVLWLLILQKNRQYAHWCSSEIVCLFVLTSGPT